MLKTVLIAFIAAAAMLVLSGYGYSDTSKKQVGSMENTDARYLRMQLDGHEIIVELEDNKAAENLLAMLPLDLNFKDYNGTEKIANLPGRLVISDSPTTCNPVAGSFTYFIPWGNLAVFYRDFRPSQNLVPLGKIISGMDFIKNMPDGSIARMEIFNK